MSTHGRLWTRDELLVAFNLYCRIPYGRLHSGNADIIAAARKLGRTPGSVAMKLCNFASLDPVQRARKIAGLRNVSEADRAIFAEFEANWEALASESEAALERLQVPLSGLEEETAEKLAARVKETEAIRSVRIRRAQSLFRATVLASYDLKCAVSGISIPALLQASHIIPWAREPSRRLDPRNGIALSALHDRAFDRGLMTFDDDFRVVLSSRLRVRNASEVYRCALLSLESKRLRMPSRYAPDPTALAYHRQHVFIS